MPQIDTVAASATVSFNESEPDHCTFEPGGPYGLNQSQSLAIEFSGFPESSTLTQLVLRSISNPERVITYPPQAGPSGFFALSPASDDPLPLAELELLVTDEEDPESADDWHLSLAGSRGGTPGGPWSTDPEVINKAGGH